MKTVGPVSCAICLRAEKRIGLLTRHPVAARYYSWNLKGDYWGQSLEAMQITN